jgi:predicted Zn finger-like uncharacterized protein
MIIQCQSCAAKYFLSEERIPASPLKVRCPKCRAVFMLAGRKERVPGNVAAPSVATPRSEEAMAHAPARPAAVAAVVEAVPAVEAAAPAMNAASDPAVAAGESAPTPATTPAAPEAARPARGGKSADDRAKRLARVLVSDILWYNRERRDAALRDGTLMTSLGEEIKKSWELYKEKVGPEAAHSTNYFKEALNEILADGQQVF